MSVAAQSPFASFWTCPTCWAAGEPGTELLVWDDADAAAAPWLFIACAIHGCILIGVPFDARLIELVRGTS